MSERFRVRVKGTVSWLAGEVPGVDKDGYTVAWSTSNREAARVFGGPGWRSFFAREPERFEIVDEPEPDPPVEMPDRIVVHDGYSTRWAVYPDGREVAVERLPERDRLAIGAESDRRYNAYGELVVELETIVAHCPCTLGGLLAWLVPLIARAKGGAA